MRSILAAGLIAAGAWCVGASPSVAAPANGVALGDAAGELGVAESVHCRRYVHWHSWGRGTGCGRRGAVVIHEGVRVRRPGVSVRVRTGDRVRSSTSIRSRESTTVRGGGREGGGATIRSGQDGGGRTGQGGAAQRERSGGGGGGGGGTGNGTGAITGYQGLCVDVRGANSTNFTPVQVYTCNGTNAQQWTVVEAGSTLHALGKCMDINGGGTADGTTVDLYDCNNTAAQVFIPQSNGSLYNPQSNKCLDDTGWRGSGTQLEIWDCTGNANQHWNLP